MSNRAINIIIIIITTPPYLPPPPPASAPPLSPSPSPHAVPSLELVCKCSHLMVGYQRAPEPPLFQYRTLGTQHHQLWDVFVEFCHPAHLTEASGQVLTMLRRRFGNLLLLAPLLHQAPPLCCIRLHLSAASGSTPLLYQAPPLSTASGFSRSHKHNAVSAVPMAIGGWRQKDTICRLAT